MQTANGDFDFLNDKNICSACWRCSVLTMEGGTLRVKHKHRAHLFNKVFQQQQLYPQQKIFTVDNRRTNSCLGTTVLNIIINTKKIFKKTEETPGKVSIKLPNIFKRWVDTYFTLFGKLLKNIANIVFYFQIYSFRLNWMKFK